MSKATSLSTLKQTRNGRKNPVLPESLWCKDTSSGYHRLEQSISNPDAVARQEVAFSDYLQNTLGTMSGRIIDSPYDYSRDFPNVSSDHAESFNNAVQDTLKTKYLHDAYSKTIGDYNYGSALSRL